MPRRPRVFLPNQPIHLVQRGHNSSQVFHGAKDAKIYLSWLKDTSLKHDVAVHAYVLMPDHVHLLMSPKTEQSIPRAMRDLNWNYSRYVNAEYKRSGSLWDGRYKACIIDAEDYLFACCQYVESNPTRIGLTEDPATYRWSSYKANALAATNSILTPHPLYLNLGVTQTERAKTYRDMFEKGLPEWRIAAIAAATNGGWALGRDSFEAQITRQVGQNMAPRGPGRPWPKKTEQNKLND